jgi:IS30 family transposase
LSYTHFTLEERKYLQQLLSEDRSFREIAAILGRDVSSISREVKRNRSKHSQYRKLYNRYGYNHWRANTLYICRRREQNRQSLKPDTLEWEYIIAGLQHYWSPEAICGRWHKEFPDRKPLCVSTIYRYIRLGKFPKISAKQHLRRRGKRNQT